MSRANLRLLSLLGISSAVHAGVLLAYGYLSNTEPLAKESGAASMVSVTLHQPMKPLSEPKPLIPPAEPMPWVSAAESREVVTTVSTLARHQVVLAMETKAVERSAVVQPQARAVQDQTIEPEQSEVVAEVAVEPQPVEAELLVVESPAVAMETAVEPLPSVAELDGPGVDKEQFAVLRQQVGEQLLQSFDDHFRYPLKARRKGWQGDVLLTVELTELGQIEQVRLLKSSGYHSLDSAALKSMRQVQAIASLDLPERLSVQVPISYRLVN